MDTCTVISRASAHVKASTYTLDILADTWSAYSEDYGTL